MKLCFVHENRLTIQITHEWTTPEDQTLAHMTNRSGDALEGKQSIIFVQIIKQQKLYLGNSVAVYQDAFLEMTESTDRNPFEDKAEPDGNKGYVDFMRKTKYLGLFLGPFFVTCIKHLFCYSHHLFCL